MDARIIDGALGARTGRGLRLVLTTSLAAALGLAALHGAAVRAEEVAFPLTVVDDEGTEVTIDAPPERIISLSPANTEIVFALGAGDRLVGGTAFDDFPAEAIDLPDVATYQGVVTEQVVGLEPDLVLAAGNYFTPPEDVSRLRELGFPVIVVYAPDVLAVLADIELIGAAIGARDEAAVMTAQMSQQLDAVAAAAAATGSTPRTFYEIGSEPEIYAPAPESFVADMVALAGGDPITTSDPVVFSIPLEELVVADPEVIVVGDANYGVCPADVAARPGWGDITAVLNGDVRPVDDVPVTRPGPRLAQGLVSLARAIHPEIELPGFPAELALCPAG
jgi:iron complex transport system substrate-binding protein